MKREAIALLLHPYKDSLVPRALLRESIDYFIEAVCSVHQQYPQLRYNIIIPGYILECADPVLIARIRDLCKKNIVEIISTGYTEPFLSLSPPDLTIMNIRHGIKIIEELTGQTPRGFFPPYSNWEPSFIGGLRELGFRYTLLSNNLLPIENRSLCGYWVAEHIGSSIGLVGTAACEVLPLKSNFMDMIKTLFEKNTSGDSNPFIVLHYKMPLNKEKIGEACKRLLGMVREIDKHLLNYQPVCLGGIIDTINPLGMQYVPASLQINRKRGVDLHFLNYFFSFDQIGFMQRKLLDIYERLVPHLSSRVSQPLLRELFFAQDINRFLPSKESGFEVSFDRASTYRRLLSIDAKIRSIGDHCGTRVRITDFSHTGMKTIILSNKNLKVFIDPQNGGQITGFDYRPRLVNICGAYNSLPRKLPGIIVSGSSRTWFMDRIIPSSGGEPENSAQIFGDEANFKTSVLDYKIRKNSDNINIHMSGYGSFSLDDKQMPLNVEKVFGMGNDHPELSFVYQFTNPSLMSFSFILAIDLHLFLQGVMYDALVLHAGKSCYKSAGGELLRIPSLTAWSIDDKYSGVKFMFQTQKPMTLWLIPPKDDTKRECGVWLILTSEISMEQSSTYKIVGKIIGKSIRHTSGEVDAI